VTNAQVIIDQEKKEVRMTGDDFEKVFKMVDNNDKRLIDDEQNEYEFSYDEK
jgi:predicted nucleic-acid-binding Zn-ribbon protein